MNTSQQAMSDEARRVLASARVEGTTVFLPPEQLERTLYEEVNEALTRLGGKWQRRARGHVFETCPDEELAVVVQTGLLPPKNPLAFFSTPKPVQETLLYFLSANMEIERGMRFLEPSAGKGAIAFALRGFLEHMRALEGSVVHVCELQPVFARFLEGHSFPVVASDFLAYTPDHPYDAVLMNPPFAVEGDRHAYITHILHAWEVVRPGGVVVSVAPSGFTFAGARREKRVRDFLAFVEEEGRWDPLPDESFKESGTGVQTVLVTLKKPADATAPAMTGASDSQGKHSPQGPPLSPQEMERALTVVEAVGQAIAAEERREHVPVFGDPTWIARARTHGRR